VNAKGTPKDSYNPDKAWKEIVSQFRRLCFMRRMGRGEESVKPLWKDLSDMIARWSRAVNEPYNAKRSRLERMFLEEQRRVADACMLHELSLMQWQQDVVPVLTERITQEVRTLVTSEFEAQAARQQQLGQELQTLAGQFEQEAARRATQEAVLETVQKTVEQAVKKLPPAPVRIPFDDIPTIIDMLNDEERRIPSARKKFSVPPPQARPPERADPSDNIRVTLREVHEAVAYGAIAG
jgi:hypothetical protein